MCSQLHAQRKKNSEEENGDEIDLGNNKNFDEFLIEEANVAG